MRWVATGFGPFGEFRENPSSWVAERLGLPFQILDVRFDVVDDFIQQLEPDSFDALLMIGAAGSAEKLRLERVARNLCGETPDGIDVRNGPAPIDPKEPGQLSSNLWLPESAAIAPNEIEDSTDAGDYLCNYALFRALQRFPNKHVGFLHVPPKDSISLERQLELTKMLIDSATSTED